MIHTKVCIIGAGPAGAAAALQLNKQNINCVIVDKAIFPRDKICGDGLSGKVIASLKRIDTEVVKRLQQALFKVDSWGVSFHAPCREQLDIGFRPDFEKYKTVYSDHPIGYVCKRMDFDNFLLNEVKRCKHVQLFEGVKIDKYQSEKDGYVMYGNKGFRAKAEIIINACGAHSSFAKETAGLRMEPKHYVAGVRAYVKNIKGLHKDNFIELHFLKDLLPGYFWVFPLPNGEANIGVCLLSSEIRNRKLNLKKELLHIIENDPIIKERFKNAEVTGSIDGYGLPLGSKRRRISGERYLLAGDAAYLIDPFTGEGIGNAICSGRIAGEQAALALQKNDLSAKALQAYDDEIYRVLGKELKLSRRMQQLARYSWLFNIIFITGKRNKGIQELMSSMFYEIDIRKKLTRPSFYLKLLLNKK